MNFGMFTDFHVRQNMSQAEAFDESFRQVEEAEKLATFDVQVEGMDCCEFAVALGHALEPDHTTSKCRRPIKRISSTWRASSPMRKRRCEASAGY